MFTRCIKSDERHRAQFNEVNANIDTSIMLTKSINADQKDCLFRSRNILVTNSKIMIPASVKPYTVV